MTIRVLIVDDDALVRRALTMVLGAEQDLEVVGESEDGETALTAAERLHPDVVLMDIRMPRMDGIGATERITAQEPAPRVLALTTFGDESYVYEALRAGASGFLLKNAPTEQLVDAVRTVAAGEALLSPAVTRAVVERYVRQPRAAPATPPAALAELTARELEVMRHIAFGLSNHEIARALVVGESTVKTHVARIFMKLGLRDRAQVVVAAYESGLVEPGQH